MGIIIPINWAYFNKLDIADDIEHTFEYLCADFLKIHHKLPITPALGGTTYTGTEGPPTKGNDGNWYGFQAKFGNEPFTLKEIINSCNNISDSTEILVIFTKENYPSDRPTSKKVSFDVNKPNKTKWWWDNYTNTVLKKRFKEVIYFCGNEFLNQIAEYNELLLKYFPQDPVRKSIYNTSANTTPKTESDTESTVKGVYNGFEGDSSLYTKDIPSAEASQRAYSSRKLSFITHDFIMETFESLENEIAQRIFPRLEPLQFHSLGNFLDEGVKKIDRENELKEFHIELEHLISSKEDIFINYGTHKKSSLVYNTNGTIVFKNKKNGA